MSPSKTMPFGDYLTVPAVNWSTLKHMEKSPRHYKYALENPGADTIGRLKGRGTHTAVLEIERFMLEYACFKPEPGKEKAVRRGKRWDAFKEMHAEDSILKEDEYRHCIAIAKAIREDELVAPILARCKKEQVLEWVDETTGIACKARIDLLAPDGIWDLKGVKSTDNRQLANEIARLRYYAQMAWYQEAAKRALGQTLAVGLICAEHAAPYDVALNDCGGEGAIFEGWLLVRELLNRVAECRKANRWPGRYTEAQSLELPAYVFPDDEQEMTAEVFNEEEATA